MTIDEIISNNEAIAKIAYAGFKELCSRARIPDPEKEWEAMPKVEAEDTHACVKAMLQEVKTRMEAQ